MPSMSSRLVQCAVAAGMAAPSICIACWSDAERLYGVSSHLLYAVARAESDLQPGAVNRTHRDRTGTYDIGLMQINSSHLPKLASLGISESDLLEPCTNIKVGAWLLADSFASTSTISASREAKASIATRIICSARWPMSSIDRLIASPLTLRLPISFVSLATVTQ